MAIRILIHGCAGRMGQALLARASQHKKLRIIGGAERAGHAALGKPLLGGALAAPLAAFADEKLDGIVDFSAPQAAVQAAQLCARQQWFLVSGTTGFTPAQTRKLKTAARQTALLHAGNMSLAVHVLAALVRQASSFLRENWDVEIVEAHHRFKQDAPSGTALLLHEAAAQGRKQKLGAELGRRGARKASHIGVHAVRGGTLVGRHEVLFAGEGESLRLVHEAQNRDVFADGALRAAAWLHRKPPGFYRFADMLTTRRK